MQIDGSEKHRENAEFSIRESFESDSKVTSKRLRQSAKAEGPIVSTLAGMQIAERDEHSENAFPHIRESFESTSNLTASRFASFQKQEQPNS
jgi:hypothetical protein